MARNIVKARLFVSVAALVGLSSPVWAEEAAPAAAAAPAAPVAEMYKPMNDVEAKAQAVLDKHCARCHQVGKLGKRDKPAKGFGDVLQLDSLLANPKRVLPGNPDGSPMFQTIANKQMPYDLYQEGDYEKPSVGEEDLMALRDWITKAGEGDNQCAPVELSYKDLVDVMYRDLGDLPEHRRANTRYLSLRTSRPLAPPKRKWTSIARVPCACSIRSRQIPMSLP